MVRSLPLAAALAAALASAAWAHDPPTQGAPAAPAAGAMQGDQAAWIADPHIHAFYDLSVQAFANGPAKVDEAAFTRNSYALFRAFGAARGVKPEAMVEHLKLIPGQVVQIAREDPEVLKSYDNFVAAVFGPQ
jgi:hypothetical protein